MTEPPLPPQTLSLARVLELIGEGRHCAVDTHRLGFIGPGNGGLVMVYDGMPNEKHATAFFDGTAVYTTGEFPGVFGAKAGDKQWYITLFEPVVIS